LSALCHCGKGVLQRQASDLITVGGKNRISADNQCVGPHTGDFPNDSLKLSRIGYVDKNRPHAKRSVGLLILFSNEPDVCIYRIYEFADHRRSRMQLSQEFQTLRGKLGGNCRNTGDIPAGPRHIGDETNAHRVSSLRHNRNGRRRVLGGQRSNRTSRHDHVDLEFHQLCREPNNKFSLATGRAQLYEQVLVFNPAELPQRLKEGRPIGAREASC